MNYTPRKLKDFEKWVVNEFNEGHLKSPVHLSGSKGGEQEEALIEIFKDIKPNDWAFSTYRSHYHALLKGIPEDWLKNWILDNKSIHVMNKEYKFFTSALVGGCLPIALGVAMAIKRKTICDCGCHYIEPYPFEKCKEIRCCEFVGAWLQKSHVWCFIGDMTSQTGIFRECFDYAVQHKLPIKFIVECNFLSTDTDTAEVWGITRQGLVDYFYRLKTSYPEYFDYYCYERIYPHYGSGKFVSKIWENMKEDPKAKGF